MSSSLRVGQTIDRAISYLQTTQQADGSYESYSSPSQVPFVPQITYRTTFTPALVLTALSGLQSSEALSIRTRLADWLLTQKSPIWSFNYWATTAPQRTTLPYPDDLDDTFCALIGLHAHDASLISHECLGVMVKLLIATEAHIGGPYRTWLTSGAHPDAWHDVDLAVNSNIAYFLRRVAEPLPNLTKYMDQAIISGELSSPYYPSIYPILYYIARAYPGQHSQLLADYLLTRQRDGWWDTPLQTALAISALLHLGEHAACKEAIARLIETQCEDGSWIAEAFCLDPTIASQSYYSGSSTLTTALVVEALAAYSKPSKRSRKRSTNKRTSRAETLHGRIMATATAELQQLEPNLQRESLAAIDRVQQTDTRREIALLPHFFADSLKKSLSRPLGDYALHLGLANLYGWTAYTIFDDFLDDEGQAPQLPVASTMLRYSLKHFQASAPDIDSYQQLIDRTFDTIDNANSWEVSECRFVVQDGSISIGTLPQYDDGLQLANRSLGHTLTPMGVLALAGVKPTDPRARAVRRALMHYIVARQLNDDLHDWEQDLAKGHISYVVATLLRELSLPPGPYKLTSLVPALQHQFWHTTLRSVCDTMSKHTRLARAAATASTVLSSDHIIAKLVDVIDSSTTFTLNEQQKAEQFLKAYRKPHPVV
jgi:hypothetical protein